MHKPSNTSMSVNRVVRDIMEKDLFLNISLRNGYANLSGIARFIAPRVESRLGELPNREAIMSAIKRNRGNIFSLEGAVKSALAASTVKMTTGMVQLILPNLYFPRMLDYLQAGITNGSVFLSTGLQNASFVAEKAILHNMDKSLKRLVSNIRENVSAMHLIMDRNALETPGFLTSLFEKLSMAGINVIGTANSYSDLVILVDDDNSSDAFSAINDMIRYSRLP
ncbi:MAG: ACT domain-containing protein [Thermoplasmataceae archaeon]|jgi:hypothetical protein